MLGCFPLWSQNSGNTRGKWNDILSKPLVMVLTIVYSVLNSLIRAKNRIVHNGTANFGRNIQMEISRPPP